MTGQPILALRGVVKRFPGVVALDGIDIALHPGEVHALLGENGAGKSTLVGLLAGTQRPDAGAVLMQGAALDGHSPALALARGIGVVTQHSELVPTLTVAENLLLGGAWWRRPDRAGMAARFRASCAGFGVAIDPAARAGSLSPGAQIQAEIVRALLRGGRVLVLDEPTSPLGPAASAHLLAHLRRLRESGLAILLITHRLDEALSAADRVTVLRRGRVTGTLTPQDLAAAAREDVQARIRAMMFGALATASPPPAAAPPPRAQRAEVVRVRGLHVGDALADVSFSIAAGEILGLAGIDGNGQTALAETLAGLRRPTAGSILLDGAPLPSRAGAVRYLSDDRMGEGTVGALSLALNLLLKRIGAAPFWRFGVQRDAAIAGYAGDKVAAFDIRVPNAWTPVAALSGGNRQKTMLARELDGAPRLIVYHKPTVGLDAHSAEAVHGRIRHAAEAGAASLLISADLDEILALAQRIAVLGRGRLLGVVENGPAARGQIAALMTQ